MCEGWMAMDGYDDGIVAHFLRCCSRVGHILKYVRVWCGHGSSVSNVPFYDTKKEKEALAIEMLSAFRARRLYAHYVHWTRLNNFSTTRKQNRIDNNNRGDKVKKKKRCEWQKWRLKSRWGAYHPNSIDFWARCWHILCFSSMCIILITVLAHESRHSHLLSIIKLKKKIAISSPFLFFELLSDLPKCFFLSKFHCAVATTLICRVLKITHTHTHT